MTTEAPDEVPALESSKASRTRRLLIAFGIAAGVLAVYVLSLVGVNLLSKSAPPLPPVDLSKYAEDDTLIQLRLDEIKPATNRLSVSVQVYPNNSLIDKNSDILTADAAVRLDPSNNLGDLQYPKGKAAAQVSTTIEVHGSVGDWPFDEYKTDEISGVVFTDNYRDKAWARMEVTGALDGWDAQVTRVHDVEDTAHPDSLDNVVLTLHRSKGPLIFDLGLCLVLITLPVLALWLAIPMLLGRTTFLPPFGTWYAGMLFAVVPLRNFFPGAPPAGAWVDKAVVLWVLIALVVAMTLFITAWWRQRDRKTPAKKT